MSRIVTPSSLKWLLNKRARLLGEIKKLEKSFPERLSNARQNIEHAESALIQAKEQLTYQEMMGVKVIAALKADLHAIDAAMGLHEIQINPELIQPIRSQDAGRVLPYGEITRSIYDCLKYAGGGPATTIEIAAFIADHNDLKLSDIEFQFLRISVRYRLKTLCAQGKIERLHQAKGAPVGKWALPKDPTQPIPEWKTKVTRPRA